MLSFWQRLQSVRSNKVRLTARSRRRRFRFECLERRAMLSVNGDFNGDGFDDLAVGAPDEDVDGIVDAGAVNIVYGSANGLTSDNNQYWHRNQAGVNGVLETDEAFGSALAVGDFNGDGFSDLAIGVPFDDNAGSVNVLYGSASGLTASGDQLWSQDSSGINDTAETGDNFGRALAAGDFNGDGRDDLAIGVPSEDEGAIGNSGMVNIIYGSASGLTNSGDQHWHQNSSGINGTVKDGDLFGFCLAAGDFDADGRDDLAIGVPWEEVDGAVGSGMVSVIYGSASGLTNAGDQTWHQNSSGINGAADDGDLFGACLAVGDFNADGSDDLAIGVPYEDVRGIENSGMVNIIYGSATGLTNSGDQGWNQDSSEGIADTSEPSDLFGYALAAGDFNGDGFDDLAIGVPLENLESIDDVGAVQVLFGSAGGIATVNEKFWHQDIDNVPGIGEDDDRFGSALVTGDYDGDGRADLAIGIPLNDAFFGAESGALIVIYSYGLIHPQSSFWSQDNFGLLLSEPGDHFGAALG